MADRPLPAGLLWLEGRPGKLRKWEQHRGWRRGMWLAGPYGSAGFGTSQ